MTASSKLAAAARTVLAFGLIGTVSLADSTAPSAAPADAVRETPPADSAQRPDDLFRRYEREIRRVTNQGDFRLARERVDAARRQFQPPERYVEITCQLDSLSRYIAGEERMSAARSRRAMTPGRPAGAWVRRNVTPPSTESQQIALAGVPSVAAVAAQPAVKLAAADERRDGADSREPQPRRSPPAVHLPEGTSFEEAINWFRKTSGLSVDVNWNALSAVGVDRTTDTLGITLQEARFETVLQLLLAKVSPPEAPLDYDIVDDVVRISTRELLDRRRITRVYDVSDLLIRVPSFRSDADGFGMGGLMGGGYGGMGMGGFGGYGGYGGVIGGGTGVPGLFNSGLQRP